jgi:LacI family transcriptional regulator
MHLQAIHLAENALPPAPEGRSLPEAPMPSAGSKARRRRVLLALEWFPHDLACGIAHHAGRAGWQVDQGTYFLRERPELRDWDGAIVWLLPRRRREIRALRAGRLPIVNLSLQLAHVPWPLVCTDNAAIARQAAEYFLGRGYRHFLYAAPHDEGAFGERRKAFQDALRARGHGCHLLDWRRGGDETVRAGFVRHAGCRVRRMPRPLAIFAANDPTALMVLDACLGAGLRVPQDAAILGVDNDAIFNELAAVPLSSVDTNTWRLGLSAADLLERLMAGGAPPPVPLRIPPAGIVTRRSSDILAIDHPGVARALQYIHECYRDPIHIREVARAAHMSHRQIQTDFKKHVGLTIFGELTRVRLDHACRLLRTTDLKTDAIAAETGLGRAERLAKVFRRRLNHTPRDYRRRFAVRAPSRPEAAP